MRRCMAVLDEHASNIQSALVERTLSIERTVQATDTFLRAVTDA